jgi:hypothetical protein
MKRIQIILIITLGFFSLDLFAQKKMANQELISSYTRDTDFGNYLMFPLSKPYENLSKTTFEGSVFPTISLLKKETKNKSLIELEALFHLTFRMYNEDSSPIYPLNFEPGFRFTKYFSTLKKNKQSFITLDLRHFSNGQSGSFYVNNSDTVNLVNGNFSTNYFLPSFSEIYRFKNGLSLKYQLGVQLEWGIPNTVFSRAVNQKDIYGSIRFLTNFQLESPEFSIWPKEKKYRLILNLENCYIGGHVPAITNGDGGDDFEENGELEAESEKMSIRARLLLKPLNGAKIGWFLQYYNGRDYYNLRFTQENRQLAFGMIYNFS